jgi:hypothetical protein
MEQIVVIVLIALLVWAAAGIGRQSAPLDRRAVAGRKPRNAGSAARDHAT